MKAMSSRNGDKARFGRLRKQKIARRLKTRELKKVIAAKAQESGSAPAPRH
jgi:hypothetical protein